MLDVGDKVRLDGEKQRYTIQARDRRFIVMTKPFNIYHTYLYTIVDLSMEARGPCDLIFGLFDDVDNPENADLALAALNSGSMGVSHRRSKDLSKKELFLLSPDDMQSQYHED